MAKFSKSAGSDFKQAVKCKKSGSSSAARGQRRHGEKPQAGDRQWYFGSPQEGLKSSQESQEEGQEDKEVLMPRWP